MRVVRHAVMATVLLYSHAASAAGEPPAFDEAFWDDESNAANAKVRRGAGLTVIGAVSLVPTVFLLRAASRDPHKYLAWGAVLGIATVGLTAHGIGSIGFGAKQREQANAFSSRHALDPGSVDPQAERDAYFHDRKKSATKVVIFGSVLSLQGSILLANAIVLSVRRSRGRDIGGATIWPSYLVGGLLLVGGTALIASSAQRIGELQALESHPVQMTRFIRIYPTYSWNPMDGEKQLGLSARVSF